MHNHHEKPRDMARSVLPSSARRSARAEKARIHRAERSHGRTQLRALARLDDPDDFDGNLTRDSRSERRWLIYDRRRADKVGPLVTWARHAVEHDPRLVDAPLDARLAHFRRLLPPGLIGDHAISHLTGTIDPAKQDIRNRTSGRRVVNPSDRDMVATIVALGGHGELNRRIRAHTAAYIRRSVTVPAVRLVDADHPAPGIVIPRHVADHVDRRRGRFLGGAHDIDAFAARVGSDVREVARGLYRELVVTRQVS